MTEAEWLAANDPTPMLDELRGKVSDRKLRLFAVACCRSVMDDSWPKRNRGVIEVAEQFADGNATDEELNRARSLACQSAQNAVQHRSRRFTQPLLTNESRLFLAADAAQRTGFAIWGMGRLSQDENLRRIGHPLLRCVFGNPFRPVILDPAWLTPTAVAIATGVYHDRAFDRLPILADALEDAGCDSADALAHLRGPGPHARGCWVVDIVLGKS